MNPGSSIPKKTLWEIVPGLAFGLVLLSILACRLSPAPEPTAVPLPNPVPGLDELHFTDTETGQRFRELNSYIDSYVDGTWDTTSYQLIGNFYESNWCRGAGAILHCQVSSSTADDRDQHILSLYTLFYDQDFPEVFGLGFNAHWVPLETGWGASFNFSEDGGGIVGDGWGVNFHEYTDSIGQPGATVHLGWDYSYEIGETYIYFTSGLSEREDLALYLAGPEAMRDRGLAQIQALALKVETEISTHQVMTCDLQPYQGNGIPPECITRPMTPEEEAAELTRAEATFTEQEQLLRDHFQELYAAWMNAFPLDRYWP